MKKNFEFKTQRGAEIKFTVDIQRITEKEIDADGWKVKVKSDDWKYNVENLTVNGQPKSGEFTKWDGKDVIRFGWQGRNPVMIALPDSVIFQIFGDEKSSAKKKQAIIDEAEDKYEAHRARMEKAMHYGKD